MNLKESVAVVLEGFTLPDDVRKILETAYYAEAQPEQEPVADKLAFYVDANTLRGMIQTYNTDHGVITWRTGDSVNESDVALYVTTTNTRGR